MSAVTKPVQSPALSVVPRTFRVEVLVAGQRHDYERTGGSTFDHVNEALERFGERARISVRRVREGQQ